MTSKSEKQQVIEESLYHLYISTVKIKRIINQNIIETTELVMKFYDTLFTDGVMGTGTPGITSRQNCRSRRYGTGLYMNTI